MRDFQHFLQILPSLLEPNTTLTSFLKAVSSAKPSDGQFMLIDEQEMIQIVMHPEIDWERLQVFSVDHYTEHPLTYLLGKMVMDSPLPLEQDLANALSQRFGAEGSIRLLQHARCIAGNSSTSYDCHSVTAARVAMISLLQEGGIDAMVDLFMRQSKSGSYWIPCGLISDPRRTPLYDSLTVSTSGMKFAVSTALAMASALAPDVVKKSLSRYHEGITPWEAIDAVSVLWGSQANIDNIRNGMLYVLKRIPSETHLREFIDQALPMAAGQTAFEKLDVQLNATLIVNALQCDQASVIINAVRDRVTDEQWKEIAYHIYVEDAVDRTFDVVHRVHKLGHQSPLYQEIARQPAFENLLHAYRDDSYVPRQLATVVHQLSRLIEKENEPQDLFAQQLIRFSKNNKHVLKGIGLAFELFREFDFFGAVVSQHIDKEALIQSAFKGIGKDWERRTCGLRVLEILVSHEIVEPKSVYSRIKNMKEFELFARHDGHDETIIRQHLHAKVKKSMVSSDFSL